MDQLLASSRLRRVVSHDGTSIACWQSGHGPPLVAVHGVTIDHTGWDGVRAEIGRQRTLVAIDRRGHGASGEGPVEHALEREVDDLLAVLDDTDAPADVLAHSYGGLVALEAALRSRRMRRLVVYEPSIDDDPDFPGVLERVAALVAAGHHEQAAETLLVKRSGVPPDAIESVRGLPLWPILLRGVQMLPREGAAMVAYHFDARRFAALTTPTLILVGGESPAWRHDAMHALDAALPRSELRALAGQAHLATHTAPGLLAEETLSFLGRS
jgi:pimeloyl-ACP methyl ester carboxylesterase